MSEELIVSLLPLSFAVIVSLLVTLFYYRRQAISLYSLSENRLERLIEKKEAIEALEIDLIHAREDFERLEWDLNQEKASHARTLGELIRKQCNEAVIVSISLLADQKKIN